MKILLSGLIAACASFATAASESTVSFEWINAHLDEHEGSAVDHVSFTINPPIPGESASDRDIQRMQLNPVFPVSALSSNLLAQEFKARTRCNAYKTAIRMAENRELVRLHSRDLELLKLSIQSREAKFKSSRESHLALMGLQNERSETENRLLILSNRWNLLIIQLNGLLKGPQTDPTPRLPVIVSLSSPVFRNHIELARGNPQLRLLKQARAPINSERSDLVEIYHRQISLAVARLITEINNLALRYAMYSDELQLRRQESVAAAIVGLESGRLALADVVLQRRRLVNDEMQMAKLRREQHELLAELVSLCGAESYSDLLKPSRRSAR